MLFDLFTAIALFSSAFVVKASPITTAEEIAAFTERSTPLAQVITTCTVPNSVAVTFDDGPYDYVEDISKQLIAAGGKGTFFWNGNNWRCIYDPASVARVKYIYGKGHMVGQHTWDHPDLTKLTFDQIHNEFWLIEQALERILGIKPAFMRPPYGNYNDLVRQVAYQRGQKMVTWDFDSGDSTGSTPAQSEAAYDAAIKKHPKTMLALNHEVYNTTVYEVLPHAIKSLKAAGYKLVTVAECMGMKPYQSVSAPQTGSWSC